MVKFILLSTIATVFLKAAYGLNATHIIGALAEGKIVPDVFDAFEPVAELKIVYGNDNEVGNGNTIPYTSLEDAPQVMFQGSKTSEYTFLVANVDAETSQNHILWLKSNINVGQNDGEDITAYKSPSKPSNSSDESSPQRLVYALFEQPFKNITTDSLDNNSIEKDLKQFVKDNNLVLVNAAYIYTQSPESADIVQRLQRITISFKEDGLLDSLVNTIDHLLGEVEDLLGIHLGLGSSPPKKPKQPKKPASKNEEGFNDDDADFEQNSMNIEERKANILHRVQRITDTFEVNGLLNSVLDIVKQLVGEIEDLLGVGAGTGRNNKGVKKNDDGDLLVGLSEEPVQELARDEMTLDNQRAVMTERLQRIAQVVNRAGLLQPVLDLVNNLLGEVEGILGIGPGRRRGKNNNGNDDREEGSRGLLGNLLGGLLGGLNEEEPVEAIQAAAVVTNNSEETAATVQDQSSMTVERLQRIAAAANEVGLLDPVLDVVRSLLDEIEAALGLNLDMGSGKNEIDEGSLLDVEHPYSGIGQDSEVIENHPRNFRRHARF